MFTIEHTMVQWNSKSWSFKIQPYSGPIYQWKMQSLALDKKAKCLPKVKEKRTEQSKMMIYFHYSSALCINQARITLWKLKNDFSSINSTRIWLNSKSPWFTISLHLETVNDWDLRTFRLQIQIPNLPHNFEFRYGIWDRFHFYTDLIENFKNVHRIC